MSQPTGQQSADQRHWQLRADEVAASQLDPLLACLVTLTKHFDRPMSPEALTAGLPLVDNHLTPNLFVRAAARAGLSARLVKRPLAKISAVVLPAVLLLTNERACVITELVGRDGARIVVPESGSGTSTLKLPDLEKEYAGFALFVKPEFEFDDRSRIDDDVPSGKSWFWGTIRGLWPAYVEVIIAAAIVNVLALASPLFIMNVYDRVLPNQAFATLWVLVIGMGIALLFDFLLRNLRGSLIDTVGRRADVLLASRIFEQVLNLQMKVRPASTGAFANHLREFETVRDFFTSATLASLTDLLFVGLFVFIIYVIAGPLAWIPAVAVIIAIVTGLLIQWPLARAIRQTQREAAQKHAILIETVSALDTIKSLGAEGRMQRSWERFVGMTSRTAQKTRFFSTIGVNLTTLVTQAVSVCTVVGGVYLVAEGQITMGAIIAAVILGGRAVGPLGGVANTLARYNQSASALSTLNRLMELPVERPADKRYVSRPVQYGRVELRDLTFRYPDAEVPALSNVSFRIDPGERVGIIGRIGSGKTTIGRLLINLYEPDEGAVLVDSVDLRQYHPSDIRRGVGFVMQDVVLFYGTVRDNIALGHPKADDALILRAAKLAGVDDFVGTHPQGYNMEVAERGQNLSGGQRQAIALARALLMDPLILMLDEPTSAMDNASEHIFMRRLAAVLNSGRTLLLTTHRMALLRLVERLIILDRGTIIADGPRDEVLQNLKEGQIGGPESRGQIGGQRSQSDAALGGPGTALPPEAKTDPPASGDTGDMEIQTAPPARRPPGLPLDDIPMPEPSEPPSDLSADTEEPAEASSESEPGHADTEPEPPIKKYRPLDLRALRRKSGDDRPKPDPFEDAGGLSVAADSSPDGDAAETDTSDPRPTYRVTPAVFEHAGDPSAAADPGSDADTAEPEAADPQQTDPVKPALFEDVGGPTLSADPAPDADAAEPEAADPQPTDPVKPALFEDVGGPTLAADPPPVDDAAESEAADPRPTYRVTPVASLNVGPMPRRPAEDPPAGSESDNEDSGDGRSDWPSYSTRFDRG